MAAAAAPSVALTGVVLEPLSRDNYEDWSTLVKNYLAGQDLWDNIVEGDIITDNEQNQVWKLKNSRALHVIQLSCGNPSLAYVRHCKKAKEAWNILSVRFDGGMDLRSHSDDIEKGVHSSDDEICSADKMRALRDAVATEQGEILQDLLKREAQLRYVKDRQGNTPLFLAAELTDNVNMAKILVQKERDVTVQNGNGEIPVLFASANGRKKLTRYLFSVTPWRVLELDNCRYASLLFSRCISAEIFDVAVALLQHHGNALDLAIRDESNSCWPPICALASIPSAFPSEIRLGLRRKAFYKMLRIQTSKCIGDKRIEIRPPRNGSQDTLLGRIFLPLQHFVQTSTLLKLPGIKEIYEMKMNHYLVLEILEYFCARIRGSSEAQQRRWFAFDAMLQAASHGIIEFIESMKKANAILLYAIDRNRRGILAHAILNRQEKVFNLIKGHKVLKSFREDVLRNNILHLAADFSRSTSGAERGATIQLLREFLWFKEVKSIAPRKCSESKNELGFTPHELFTVNHERLVRDSEQWLKDMSAMSITVGTVIITLMFAAAITVPGGNDQNKGTPIFLGKKAFTLFTILDIVSLIASSSSVMTFIAILTSSYGEEDFIRWLPPKLLFGFLTLFLSVMSMICAFYATLISSLKAYDRWIVTAVGAITFILMCTVIPSMMLLPWQILKCIVRYRLLTTKKKKSRDV